MWRPLWDRGVRIGESWTLLVAPRLRGGVLGRGGGVDGRGWVVVVVGSGTSAGVGGGSWWPAGFFLDLVRRSRVGDTGMGGRARDFWEDCKYGRNIHAERELTFGGVL